MTIATNMCHYYKLLYVAEAKTTRHLKSRHSRSKFYCCSIKFQHETQEMYYVVILRKSCRKRNIEHSKTSNFAKLQPCYYLSSKFLWCFTDKIDSWPSSIIAAKKIETQNINQRAFQQGSRKFYWSNLSRQKKS